MSKSNSSSSGGIGFVGMLTILFIALKLTGVIAWSWWWVISPIWIATALVALVVIGTAIISVASDERKAKKRRESRLRKVDPNEKKAA